MRINIPGLTPGQTYNVQLRSTDGTNFSAWSRTFQLVVDSDTAPLPDIENLVLQSVGDSFVATWTYANRPNDFRGFDIRWYDGTTYSNIYRVGGESAYTATLTFSENAGIFNTAKSPMRIEVKAVDNSGNSSPGILSSAVVNPIPTQISTPVPNAGNNQVMVSWPAATFDDYAYTEIYGEVGSGTSPTAGTGLGRVVGTSFVHFTSSYGSALYYKVRHFDKFGQGSTLAGVSAAAVAPNNPALIDVTPPADPNVPTATPSLDADDATGSTGIIDVSFNSKTEADLAGHNLRYSSTNGSEWTYIDIPLTGTRGGVNAQAAQIKGLFAGKTYYVQIQAYDAVNNLSGWVATSPTGTAVPNDTTVPGDVTGLVLTKSPTSVHMTWTKLTTADVVSGGAYVIEIDTANTFATGNKKTFEAAGNMGFASYGGLSAGSTWYARIKAKDRAGNVSTNWALSSPTSVTLGTTGDNVQYSDGAAPASSPTPTVTGVIGGLYANWTPVANNDPVTYEVHISTSTGFTPAANTKATEVDGSSVIIERLPSTHVLGGIVLAPATTYYIKIVAKDRDGSATASAQGSGSFTTISSTQVGFTAAAIGAPTIYYTGTSPAHSGAANSGLWYNTSAGNALSVWNGSAWTLSKYGTGALGDNSVTGTIIAGTTITGANIVGNTITSSEINSNAITADELAAGAVTAKHLVVGTLGMNPVNPNFEFVDGSNNAIGWTKDAAAGGPNATIVTTTNATDVASGTRALSMTAAVGEWARVRSDVFPMNFVSAYPVYFDASIKASAGTPLFQLELHTYTTSDGTGSATINTIVSSTATTSYARYAGNLILGPSATVKSARWVVVNYTASSTIFVDAVDAGIAVNGTRIASGSITTAMITVGGLNASAITAGSITTDRFTSNTINASIITGGTINADKITSNTTFTQNINVGDASGGGITVTAAGGYIKSSNYTSTAGYRLTSTGLEINDGTISAKAIILQDPTNLVPAQYSNFDWAASSYSGTHLFTGTTINNYAETTYGGAPGGSGAAISFISDAAAPSTTNHGIYLSSSSTDYNIAVEPNTEYTFSCYIMGFTGAGTLTMGYKHSGGGTGGSKSYASIGAGFTSSDRYSHTFTTGAGTTSICLYLRGAPSNSIIWATGFQLEKGAQATRYKMPGQTRLNANSIYTGSLISTQTTTIGSNTLVPKWSINMDGDAMLNSAVLRGGIVVGVSGDSTNSRVQSADYVANTTGWRIQYNGNAEFNNLVARGSLYAGTNSALTVDNATGFTLTREAVTNLVTNPSFEGNNTTNWTFSNATTLVHGPGQGFVDVGVAAGTYTLYSSAQAASTAYAQNTINTTGLGGKKIWVSWYVYSWSRVNRIPYGELKVIENGGAARTLTGSGSSLQCPVGTWTRVYHSITLPSDWHTSTLLRIPMGVMDVNSTWSSSAFYMDAIQVTATNEITEYFDGENGGSWTGTTHLSSSTKAAFNVIDYKIKSGGESTLRALDAMYLKNPAPMRDPAYITGYAKDSNGGPFVTGIEFNAGRNTKSPYKNPSMVLGSSPTQGYILLGSVDRVNYDTSVLGFYGSATDAKVGFGSARIGPDTSLFGSGYTAVYTDGTNLHLDAYQSGGTPWTTYGVYSFSLRDYASTAVAVHVNASTGRLSKTASSRRYKSNIETINLPDGWIDEMRPVKYQENTAIAEVGEANAKVLYGFIAEEVDEIPGLDSLVIHDQDGIPDTVLYANLTALLVLEIKNLRSRVAALEA
jgi:hypothetical protein